MKLIFWLCTLLLGCLASAAQSQVTNNENMIVENRNSTRADCNFTVDDALIGSTRREGFLTLRPRRHLRSVTAINGLGVTAAALDASFDAASTLIQQDSGAGDANCCTAILRQGNVNFVNAPSGVTGGVINSSSDLDAVFDLPGDIKIVASIGFCGQSGSYNGCARGNELILFAGFAAATLAHEIGHNTGLCHVAQNCTPTCGQAGTCGDCNDPMSNNIMYPRGCAGRDRLTAAQCSTFQGGTSR